MLQSVQRNRKHSESSGAGVGGSADRNATANIAARRAASDGTTLCLNDVTTTGDTMDHFGNVANNIVQVTSTQFGSSATDFLVSICREPTIAGFIGVIATTIATASLKVAVIATTNSGILPLRPRWQSK